MARIRTIKPEFWKNEELATISTEAVLLAIGLLNYADDEGLFNANHALIKAEIFPIRNLSRNIPTLLTELQNIGYIFLYNGTDKKSYGKIATFTEHQVINRPQPSKIAHLIDFTELSVNNHGAFTRERKGKERKGREGSKEIFQKFIDSDFSENLKQWWIENNIQLPMLKMKERVIDYVQQSGKYYNDYEATMRNWARKETSSNPAKPTKKLNIMDM